MPDLGKVEYLVVDTSAFIKNVQLQELGANIVSVQAVVDEILNKRQLRNLVVLPYNLQIKDAFSEDIKHVTEFSKKTGDYPSLSAADIQVMAVTYRLEKEKVGSNHLKENPQINRVISLTTHLDESYKNIAGFYLPHKKEDAEVESTEDVIENPPPHTDINQKSPILETEFSHAEQESIKQAILEDRLPELLEQEERVSDDNAESFEDEDDSDEFDDNDWITPSNIAQVKQEMVPEEAITGPIMVACITADFAMQNVMKQMGLQVLSVDGRMIHQLRTFILRCYSCFKTTSIMTKIFCPHCGNKTLKRVAVSLREDGTQEIHLSTKKRITGRGKRFPLPRPQGGKHANNPILCEDQHIPQQHPSRLARKKTDPLEPDYVAGFSPFVMRDVTSRSAMLGIRGTEVKNWMRRNPNEVRRKGKKKK